jgi:hypothetical protein
MKVIGVCGLIGGGKGTVADILVGEFGFEKLSFADSLKDVIASVFTWPRHLLEGDTKESREWRETVDNWWSARLAIPNLTPRWVLQYWGTEVCRVGFHEEIWVASLERKIKSIGIGSVNKPHNFVIPDTRFPNEIQMIRKLGGQVWAVRRGEDPDWLVNLITKGEEPNDIHPSEWSWVTQNVDTLIDNSGTIEDLKSKVSTLLDNIHI